MSTFLEHVGGIIDRWWGSNYTREFNYRPESATQSLQSRVTEDGYHLTITSRRKTYVTTYRRWLFRVHRHRVVYEVVCTAPPEVKEKLDPIFFIPVTFPLLCNRLLQWTPYPHILAIHAFLERIPHLSSTSHREMGM